MTATHGAQQRTGTAPAARLRLTDTGVEVVDESGPPTTNRQPAAESAATPADGAENTAPLLDEGDAPADVAQLEAQARQSRFRRILRAAGVVAGLLAALAGAGYFWFSGGAQADTAYQVKPVAPAGPDAADPAARGLTAEEITQEIQKHAPSVGATPFQAPIGAADAALPSPSPLTERLPRQDLSATVLPAGTPPAPDVAARPSARSTAPVTPDGPRSSGGAAAGTSQAAPPTPTPAPASWPAAHSLRVLPSPTPTQAGTPPIVTNGTSGAASPVVVTTPAATPPVGDTTTQTTAGLPPLGTLLPVRTVATIYTLRHTAYVRLQVTRDVAGPGWAVSRGTEFYGQLSGADSRTRRAFVTLLGFLDPHTKQWRELSGQLLGADGTEGLPGRAHQAHAGWRNAFKKAGSVALETLTALASGLGRRPVVITDGGAGRVLDPLTREAPGLAEGREGDSFIEVPAATAGYILVITDPAQARE